VDECNPWMRVDPEYKRIEGEAKPEKHALRALFDGEIPEPVLWRTKAMQCEAGAYTRPLLSST
jgi:hypothetical protein